MGVVRLRVSKDGQLVLPDELRRVLGIEDGGEVVATYEGRRVRIEPPIASLAEIGAELARSLPEGAHLSVDDFLEQRRRDAAEE